MIDFLMPSLGADMEDGTLREWRVKPGDMVKRGDIIADVETQKGIIEIEVFDEGKIDKLLIAVDQKVPVGTVMAQIIPIKETAVKEVKKAIETIVEKKIDVKIPSIPVAHGVKVSPLARKIASENHIDLSLIKGTGEGGAITKDDVNKVLAGKGENKKETGSSSPSEGIRMAVAAAMSRSNREIPHYYLETKADMTNALNLLADENKRRPVQKRILPAALLIRAVARALGEVPELNAVWDNGLKLKSEINVGFVVSLRRGGIVVPAIHAADKKNTGEIMEALSDIILRTRSMKLRSSELSDSTITVTNLGEGGVETVFGVVYPPQVALIGFGGITEEPWAKNGMLGVHPILHITLAADHRATDGNIGSRFLAILKSHLQNPGEL